MIKKLSRFVAVAGTIAAATVATVGLGSTGTALAAPPLGTNTLTPATGTESTNFSLTPPSGSSCTGSGSGVPAYRWRTYMVSAAVDASTLTYAAGPNAISGQFVSPLYDSAGANPVINKNPSASPLGLIAGIPTYNFAALVGDPGLVNGAYKVGYACTQAGNLDAGKYWETPITISNVTPTGFSYAFGAVPAAPVIAPATLTAGNGTLSGTFTAAASIPAQLGYTVTAISAGNPTVTLPVAAPGAFSLSGLVNGSAYDVSVTANNAVGTSAASNVVTGTPNPVAYGAVTGLTAVPGVALVDLGWTAPAGDSGRTGYTVTVSPSVAGSPFTVGAASTSLQVTGLTAGTAYTFTVVGTYPTPFSGTSASVGPVTPTDATVIVQDITVNRPVGALVLTQRCDVFGALPDGTVAGDGFGTLAAVAASGGTTGTAPTLTFPGGVADPNFGEYPYPVDANGVPDPTYPTHCGIDLGIGKLITSGPRAGQYFTATGAINQVTVVDTRDTDPGFTVNGTMSNFTNGTNTFSGNYLGWQPVVTDDSDVTLAGYDQLVVKGADLAPSLATGLATAKPLASAAAGQGLGIATLDARLKLLIPLTARNGNFTGTLTFTTI